ncbi:hypothetical protein HK097_000583, partial [Rhizophlyctis rosea]
MPFRAPPQSANGRQYQLADFVVVDDPQKRYIDPLAAKPPPAEVLLKREPVPLYSTRAVPKAGTKWAVATTPNLLARHCDPRSCTNRNAYDNNGAFVFNFAGQADAEMFLNSIDQND